MHASRYNQAAITELLCDRHADINVLNNDNRSALWYTCRFANVEATRVLLDRGANVNLGDPPILAACTSPCVHFQTEMSRLQVVRLLVKNNANLNVVDADGWTAINIASRYNQAAIIKLLLDRHVDIDALCNNNRSALYTACFWANVDAIRVLLDRGANVDLGDPPILVICLPPCVIDQAKTNMSTFWARRLQVVRLLIGHNANLNVVNAHGMTAIMRASQINQAAIIELLCDRHADIDVLDNDDESALYAACYWANVEATRVLLARGANVDLGDPPILVACTPPHEGDQAEMDMSTLWARRCEIVIELVRHNVDLHVVDAQGHGPLFLAVANKQWAIVAVLREAFGR